MKAVTICWNLALLLTITVSLPNNPKAISLDSLKRIDDITGTTQQRRISSVKWRQNSKRFQEDNDSEKQKNDVEEMIFCQPYPSIVQVPEPKGWRGSYLPSFVKLHRCAGGCSISPRIGYCAKTKEEKVSISVQFDQKTERVVMSNHTACKCACVPKECHSRQRFDDNICDCVCVDDREMECKEKTDRRWDKNLCQCVCSQARHCDFGFKWSEESCRCELESIEVL